MEMLVGLILGVLWQIHQWRQLSELEEGGDNIEN